MQDGILDMLAHVRVFENLSRDLLLQMASVCLWLKFGRGTIVFRAGCEPRGLYIVASGCVRLYRSSKTGAVQTIATEWRGGVFGEIGLVSGAHAVSALAAEPSALLLLPREGYARLSDKPEIVAAVSQLVARRASATVDLFGAVALHSAEARVAQALLNYLSPDSYRRLPCSHEELGHELALARESVTRTLSRLKSAGLVEQYRSAYRIIDPDGLKAVAESGALHRRRGGAPDLPTQEV